MQSELSHPPDVFAKYVLLFFSSSSDSQMLELRSSLELRLANHRAMAIVFQLEYVFSAPIGQEMMVRVVRGQMALKTWC